MRVQSNETTTHLNLKIIAEYLRQHPLKESRDGISPISILTPQYHNYILISKMDFNLCDDSKPIIIFSEKKHMICE